MLQMIVLIVYPYTLIMPAVLGKLFQHSTLSVQIVLFLIFPYDEDSLKVEHFNP